jgi:hypothetical protein
MDLNKYLCLHSANELHSVYINIYIVMYYIVVVVKVLHCGCSQSTTLWYTTL